MKMLLLLVFLCTSCFPSFRKSPLRFDYRPSVTSPTVEDGGPVTFNKLKEKLLIPHCLNCHKNAGTEERLALWIQPGNFEESDLYLVIKDGSMPKNGAPLDSSYLELVIKYIESTRPKDVWSN
jgi:hypothetical protein